MKLQLTLLVLFSFFYQLNAQDLNAKVGGGEYVFNAEKKPCLTPEQRTVIKSTLSQNIEELRLKNKLAFSVSNKNGGHPLFAWPIQKAAGVTFNHVWSISGYVDHNTNPNALQDYNCGTTTYDSATYNHQGVDIYTWPFTWKLMDDNSVEIIAAADGQIVAKADGRFDRSCNFNSNQWNAIYVQHSDGSIAWYGHMKNGSLSTKNIGDMVTQGEYLGIVGSSGNSTGPHLHLEVYDGASQLIDPYYGPCNSMNNDTWWATQKPYTNSGVSAALTHSAPPDIFPTCPTTETPNISSAFDTDDTIYFAAYMRDQIANESINLKIIRPDNSFLYNWDITVNTTSSSWYYYWNYTGVFDMEGEWKWEVTYNGETVSNSFTVGTLSIDEYELSNTRVYPNPFNDNIQISTNSTIIKAHVIDLNGRIIKTVSNTVDGVNTMNLERLSNGIYFLTLESDTNKRETIKLIKK